MASSDSSLQCQEDCQWSLSDEGMGSDVRQYRQPSDQGDQALWKTVFSTRQHIAYMLSALYAIARPSLSHMGGSCKTCEDRIMIFSPYGSPIPLVFAR